MWINWKNRLNLVPFLKNGLFLSYPNNKIPYWNRSEPHFGFVINTRRRKLSDSKRTSKICNSAVLDKEVAELNEDITAKIDCTTCGNCCKSLMITVSEKEADQLSKRLSITRLSFDEQYLEKGLHGLNLINTIPCHFLEQPSMLSLWGSIWRYAGNSPLCTCQIFKKGYLHILCIMEDVPLYLMWLNN